MRSEIREGYELVVGHSAENARAALDKAAENGFGPERVLRSPNGYLVPVEDVAAALPPANVEEAQARKAEAEILDVEAVEVDAPTEKDSHAEIDSFAEEFGIDLTGLGEKPTKAEKVAEINRIIEERTDALEAENKED